MPNSHKEPRLVSTAEAAARLGVSVRTMKRYVKHGKLQPSMVLPGGSYRWSEEDFKPLLFVGAGAR